MAAGCEGKIGSQAQTGSCFSGGKGWGGLGGLGVVRVGWGRGSLWGSLVWAFLGFGGSVWPAGRVVLYTEAHRRASNIWKFTASNV